VGFMVRVYDVGFRVPESGFDVRQKKKGGGVGGGRGHL